MKKKFLRLMASVLVALMVVSVAPMSELAKVKFNLDWLNLDWLNLGISASAYELSGKCGENLTYTFNEETGELSITGTGAMDYSVVNFGQIYGRNKIKSVIIGEGVTAIKSKSLFESCVSIESVVINNGLKSLGKRTFYGCTGLKSITMADSVLTIGDECFYNCTQLTDVKLSKK